MPTLKQCAVNVNWHYVIQNLVIVLKFIIINNFNNLLVFILYSNRYISKVYLIYFC
jgi:hypothetical protein